MTPLRESPKPQVNHLSLLRVTRANRNAGLTKTLSGDSVTLNMNNNREEDGGGILRWRFQRSVVGGDSESPSHPLVINQFKIRGLLPVTQAGSATPVNPPPSEVAEAAPPG